MPPPTPVAAPVTMAAFPFSLPSATINPPLFNCLTIPRMPGLRRAASTVREGSQELFSVRTDFRQILGSVELVHEDAGVTDFIQRSDHAVPVDVSTSGSRCSSSSPWLSCRCRVMRWCPAIRRASTGSPRILRCPVSITTPTFDSFRSAISSTSREGSRYTLGRYFRLRN